MKNSFNNKSLKHHDVMENITPENMKKLIDEPEDFSYLDADPYYADFIQEYLMSKCEEDSSFITTLDLLYDKYRSFCKHISFTAVDIAPFCYRLKQHGFKLYVNDGRPFVLGVRLKNKIQK